MGGFSFARSQPGLSAATLPAIALTTNKDACFEDIKSLLRSTLATVKTNPIPLGQAERPIQRLLDTAIEVLPGHFSKIEPDYEGPKFIAAVGSLNAAVACGYSKPADFNEYVSLLIAAIQAA